jgi:dienelactone hydrolase
MVMAHGFGCIRALRLPAYAQRFAAAGYVVVVFDYRYFGDSDGEPRQLLDIGAQLDDWRAAVGWARTLEGVDPQRVVGWGTSLSGGHVITLAGTGTPLTAIIAQVPHVDGFAATRAAGFRHAVRLLPAAVADTWRALVHRAPRYLDSIGAPGTCSIMATPDASAGLERMAAADGLTLEDFPITVAARIVLRIGLYSPIRHAAAIRCPALIQVVDTDALTPSRQARKMAHRLPRAMLRSYPGQHFDVYVEPLFSTVIADQLEFLRAVAPVT